MGSPNNRTIGFALGLIPLTPAKSILQLHRPGVERNQESFGKLWDRTRHKLGSSYKVTVDIRAGLYLKPLKPMPISLANVFPARQGGSLLRLQVHTEEARFLEVRSRLEDLALALPVQPFPLRNEHYGKMVLATNPFQPRESAQLGHPIAGISPLAARRSKGPRAARALPQDTATRVAVKRLEG